MLNSACVVLPSKLGELWNPVMWWQGHKITPLRIQTLVRNCLPLRLRAELLLHHFSHFLHQLIDLIPRLLHVLSIVILSALIAWVWKHVQSIVVRAVMKTLGSTVHLD